MNTITWPNKLETCHITLCITFSTPGDEGLLELVNASKI